MDEQQVELVGTAALTAALIREGFEIECPRLFLFTQEEAVALLLEGKPREANRSGPTGHWVWSKAPRNIEAKLNAYEKRWGWLRSKLRPRTQI